MNTICKWLAIALAVIGLAPARPALAVEDLQAFRGSLSPTGTITELTKAGPLDWAHWGYQMGAAAMGETDVPVANRKARGDGMPVALIGSLQVVPPITNPPAKYWMHTSSNTMRFQWTDGIPVPNLPTGTSVTDGIIGVPETTFTLAAKAGADLRELSLYVTADCTDAVQLDVSFGKQTAQLTDTELCDKHSGVEDHKLTIRYSSDDLNPPLVTVSFTGGLFGTVGPTIYAATLASVDSSGPATGHGGAGGAGGAGGMNGGAGGGGGRAGGPGPSGHGGAGGGGRTGGAGAAGAVAGSGGIGAGGSAGAPVAGGSGAAGSVGAGSTAGYGGADSASSKPEARLLACGVAPGHPAGSATGGALAALVAALAFVARRRHRPCRRISR